MNRRKFLNFLGAAVVGTAVATKLPATTEIKPTDLDTEYPLTFHNSYNIAPQGFAYHTQYCEYLPGHEYRWELLTK